MNDPVLRTISIAVLSSALACSPDSPSGDAAATATARATETATATGAGASPPPARPAPPRATAADPTSTSGESSAVESGVQLRVRYEPRLVALRQLAKEFGFDIVGQASAPARIDADLEGVTIEEAIATLLEGEPYAIHYAVDDAGAHRIDSVLLGTRDSQLRTLRLAQLQERQQARRALGQGLKQRLAEMTPEEREVELEAQRLEAERARAEKQAEIERSLVELDSADPEVRAGAVGNLDVEDIGVSLLAEIALRDDDPRVRTAAVEGLAASESQEARDALRNALSDRDPAVLIEALDSISFHGDKSDLPYVDPLRSHPNPEVAAGAVEASEFIGLGD